LKRDPPNRFVFDPKGAFEKEPKADPLKREALNPELCLAPKNALDEALLDGPKECQAPSGLPPL